MIIIRNYFYDFLGTRSLIQCVQFLTHMVYLPNELDALESRSRPSYQYSLWSVNNAHSAKKSNVIIPVAPSLTFAISNVAVDSYSIVPFSDRCESLCISITILASCFILPLSRNQRDGENGFPCRLIDSAETRQELAHVAHLPWSSTCA